MNFLSFTYFIAAANAPSIRQAANTLMISPQSLGEQLKRLEQELGVPLFTHTRPAKLTSCGERFLKYAQHMLSERQLLERDLRELTDKHREIVLSVSPGACPPFVMEAVAEFTVQHPDCLVSVVERPEPVTSMALRDYDLNISTQSLGKQMKEQILQEPRLNHYHETDDGMYTNHLAVVAHQNLLRRVWGREYEVRLRRVRQSPQLLDFQEVPFPRFFHPEFDAVLDEYFGRRGFSPCLVAKSQSADLCAELCIAAGGAMVGPDGWMRRKFGHRIHDQELILFQMEEPYPLMQTILSYGADKHLSQKEESLIELLGEFARKTQKCWD